MITDDTPDQRSHREAIAEAPVVVWHNILPHPICAMLADTYRRGEPGQYRRGDSYGPPAVQLDMDDWATVAEVLALTVGTHFDLPVGWINPAVIGYTTGMEFSWHTDYVDDLPRTHDRTVSFSCLITEPGHDFTGGEFEVSGKGGGHDVPLRLGSMVGFTALTAHRVRTVTSGQRLCLIGFGHRQPPSADTRLDT